jgi:hypothetical protein
MESNFLLSSVVDPHHLDADLDLTYHPDADSDSDVYFTRTAFEYAENFLTHSNPF